MKASKEIKKIEVGADLESATITVVFNISDFKKLDDFKDRLLRFVNEIEGQTELDGFGK